MDRRVFISKGLTTSLSIPFLSSCNEKSAHPAWQCAYNSDSLETIIAIEGLTNPLTILQISDSHISCDNESDREYEIYSARMNQAYPLVDHYKTCEKVTPMQCFSDLMELAKKENVDLIALTGDILNYPSATAVERVCNLLDDTNIPHIYVSGNHDWHYEGMPGTADQLRLKWATERLKPLYSGGIFFSSRILNGINMVVIDNSTYQINEEQLEFYKQQQARPEPIMLFAHIPIFMPTLGICCGHPDWGSDTDTGYQVERRERWSENGNKASTTEFVNQVMNTRKLIGIFTGHWHQSRAIKYQDKIQFIAGAALNGQYRMIRLVPFNVS